MKTHWLIVAALCLLSGALGFGVGNASAEGLVSGDTVTVRVTAPPAAQPMQGSCGDHRCDPPEDCNSCPGDCGSCCGNGRCESPEDCNSCPSDCGSCCGNGRCEPPEDHDSCPRDC